MKIFDSHFHIIDYRFPVIQNNGFLPDEYLVDQYLLQAQTLGIVGGAVVSGSFQGFDQGYLVTALQQLGPGFVGVTQLPVDTSDEDILALDRAGIRAVRFNLKRGGSEDVRHLESLAQRVYELARWHVELYADSSDLDDLSHTVSRLPRVSIDHLGLSAAGFSTLLKLVANGVRVKASGFGRGDLNITSAMQQIIAENPDALMFGTDLPSTRAPRPFLTSDLTLIQEQFDPVQCHKILYTNARDWYRVPVDT